MLLRYDPLREIEREFDRVFRGSAPALPIDASRHGDDFVVEMDLPGVDASSIDITIERNVMTVRAERASRRNEDWEPLVSERQHGTFTRELYLGQGLDTGNVAAEYVDGVLTLTIPVAETSKPRRIEVRNAPSNHEAVEVGTQS